MAIGTKDYAVERPGEIGLVDPRLQLTWAELNDRLNRAANGLASLGIPAGKRVAVFAENAAETVIAHLGGGLGGFSTVPVSFHLTAGELAYILNDSDSAIVLCGPETAERAVAAANEAGITTVIGWRCEGIDGVQSWEGFLEAASNAEPDSSIKPLPHLHYTSGTTGFPKGTETPPNMFSGGETFDEHLDNLQNEALLMTVGTQAVVCPMYHIGTLRSTRVLFTGVRLVVLGRFNAERLLQAIQEWKVNAMLCVPTHFQRLLALPPEVRAKYDVSSVQRVSHTGASCPVEVKRQMIEWFGPVFIDAYGATECGVTNMITSEEWLLHPGSVGKTVPQFELIVVDDDGNRLGANQEGRLYYRDLTGRGIRYHNRPEATEAAHLEPGVLTMGEVGYFDDEGYVYLTDRTSDMVVSGGVNIYPAEAERILLLHPGVLDVACIGVPNDDMGEELKALVIPRDAANPPTADELIAFCREQLAHFKCPRTVDIVDDIGRTPMGKVNKKKLRAPYWPTERTIGG
ncbi:MAG: AMP-binding protein [Acidimicrobiia bacterium]